MLKNVIKKIIRVFIIFLIMLILNIMYNNNINTIYAENDTFKLESKNIKIAIGESEYLMVQGNTKGIRWESYDPTIATVEDGMIKGISLGTTTIVAVNNNQTEMCEVTVGYDNIYIKDQKNERIYNDLNFILDTFEDKQLKAEAKDYHNNIIENPKIRWISSNPDVVEVNQSGLLKAKKTGKAEISIREKDKVDTIKVDVKEKINFGDFENCKVETLKDKNYGETLKITPKGKLSNDVEYYIKITSDNKIPKLEKDEANSIEGDKALELADINLRENYIFVPHMEKYIEKSGKMYLWIFAEKSLDEPYNDNNGNRVYYINKNLLEGKKIERRKYENRIEEINISSYYNRMKRKTEHSKSVFFDVPHYDRVRRFTLKIGKIDDPEILKQIEEGKYPENEILLTYAKNSQGIYQEELKTNHTNYSYMGDNNNFEGEKLLEDGKFYYAYVNFNDENGKYIPCELVKICYARNDKEYKYWNLGTDEINMGNTTLPPEKAEKETEELITSTRHEEFLKKMEEFEKKEKEEKRKKLELGTKIAAIIFIVMFIVILIINNRKQGKIERL